MLEWQEYSVSSIASLELYFNGTEQTGLTVIQTFSQ